VSVADTIHDIMCVLISSESMSQRRTNNAGKEGIPLSGLNNMDRQEEADGQGKTGQK
jgi:hypothetical protein